MQSVNTIDISNRIESKDISVIKVVDRNCIRVDIPNHTMSLQQLEDLVSRAKSIVEEKESVKE